MSDPTSTFQDKSCDLSNKILFKLKVEDNQQNVSYFSFVDSKSTLPSSHAMITTCAVISTQLRVKHHFAGFGSDSDPVLGPRFGLHVLT